MRSSLFMRGFDRFCFASILHAKVYGWEYKKNESVLINDYKARKCVLKKDHSELILLAAEVVAAYREDCNLY